MKRRHVSATVGVLKYAVIATCLASGLFSRMAGAETPASAKAQAQATLREGNAFLGQGRATDALMKFTEAYRLFPSPKLHYNMGQAHGLIAGHEAQAYEAMSRFLAEASDANPQLRAAAETQRQQLRPKVGLVSIAAEPSDAELLLDDVNVGKVSRDVPTVMAIGTHRLTLKKDAASSSTEMVTITGGETLQVRLALAPVVVAPLAAPPASPVLSPAPEPAATPVANAAVFPRATLIQVDSPPPASGYWTWQRKLGAGLGAVAVASLVVGVIEHVRYFGKKDEFVDAGCGTDPAILATRSDCRSLNNQFKSANTGWVVGYIAAAALGGTSAYFLWLSPGDSSPAMGGAGEKAGASMNSGLTVNFQGRF